MSYRISLVRLPILGQEAARPTDRLEAALLVELGEAREEGAEEDEAAGDVGDADGLAHL